MAVPVGALFQLIWQPATRVVALDDGSRHRGRCPAPVFRVGAWPTDAAFARAGPDRRVYRHGGRPGWRAARDPAEARSRAGSGRSRAVGYSCCRTGRRRVTTATSGGQLMRRGTTTVPTPRLTNISVLSRVRRPAAIGNFLAASAPSTRQHHLAAVGMAGQHAGDCRVTRPRRCAGDRARAAARADSRRSPPGRSRPPFSSRTSRPPDPAARRGSRGGPVVEQHFDTAAAKLGRHDALVVVVADDAEDAVRAFSAPSRSATGAMNLRSPNDT